MSMETKIKDAPSPSNQDGGANAPSGFILKLFQMVNGAPDEVISVSNKEQLSSSGIGGQGFLLRKPSFDGTMASKQLR